MYLIGFAVGRNSCKLMGREELIAMFKNLSPKQTNGLTTVGLVGYPNVGKSSTINSLLQDKKVSVSATPGKTKHFQVSITYWWANIPTILLFAWVVFFLSNIWLM